MKTLFRAMAQTLEAGQDTVLCSILASSGSTPRGAGAKMAVFEDGSTLGTIGGGAVELAAARQAFQVFTTGESYLKGFCLSPNEVEDIGMICGGNVTVYYQFLDHKRPEDLSFVQRVCQLLEEDTDAWLVSRLEGGKVVGAGIFDRDRGLQFMDRSEEAALLPHLKYRSIYLKGQSSCYIEPIVQKGQVYIFGGGHVGRALAPVLRDIDFRVTVYDNRPQLAQPGQFPAEIGFILGDYRDIGAHITLTQSDYVVIMTPGHQADYEVLEQALRTPATYVGCIGSRHKVAATQARLLQAGLTRADLERIHSPIGLEIGADTPKEIAISVAAQLIAHRAARR